MNKIKVKIVPALLVFLLAFSFTTYQASAHGDEDHSASAGTDAVKVENMKKLVSALQQLVVLLKQKSELEHSGTITTEDHHTDDADEETDELAVWVELHSNKTHAHVQQPGMKEQSWLLEDLKYTDEEEIIEAIAEKSGLSVHEIEEVIVFPSGEVDENGDSVEEHDEDADEDVSGIHIMSDGKVMWGNGTAVVGATITADGKVKLSDGRIITPAFDLR